MNVFRWLIFFIWLGILAACVRKGDSDKIKIAAYSSYNSSGELPDVLVLQKQKSKYDSLIRNSLSLAGLRNIDIEIEKTNVEGAFSVINRKSNRRFFIYCPQYFDSVYNRTGSYMSVVSICFHELAHILNQHPLKPTAASHIYEKESDWYSGYWMCIVGATLEQSLSAMNAVGNNSATSTHPDKASRLEAITRGYVDAKISLFKDSTYRNLDSLFRESDKSLAGFMGQLQDLSAMFEKSSIGIPDTVMSKSDTVAMALDEALSQGNSFELQSIYSLYGETLLVTTDNKILLASTQKVIGEFLPGGDKNNAALKIEERKYYLDKTGAVISIAPDGSKQKVGSKQ